MAAVAGHPFLGVSAFLHLGEGVYVAGAAQPGRRIGIDDLVRMISGIRWVADLTGQPFGLIRAGGRIVAGGMAGQTFGRATLLPPGGDKALQRRRLAVSAVFPHGIDPFVAALAIVAGYLGLG